MRTFPSIESRANLGLAAAYSAVESEQVMQGFTPRAMEDKWAITFEDSWLYFHRSWTGACIYGLRFERSADGVSVVESWVNRDKAQYPVTAIEYDRAMVRFLIDALILGKQAVFPDPPGEARTGWTKAIYEHAVVGRIASAATKEFIRSYRGRSKP